MNETTKHTGAELLKIYWEAFKGLDPEAAAICAVAEAVRDEFAHQQHELADLRAEVACLRGKVGR